MILQCRRNFGSGGRIVLNDEHLGHCAILKQTSAIVAAPTMNKSLP
jgi:hypothetical protein